MKYWGYMPNDFINGKGVSVSLWVTGCPFQCEGCHNPQAWNFNAGYEIPIDIKGKIIKAISANGITRNFSVLGGEPLCEDNRAFVESIVAAVRAAYPDILIYIWTGYEKSELDEINSPILNSIYEKSDILITGRFDLSQRNTTIPLRGSENQRIYDLKQNCDITNNYI